MRATIDAIADRLTDEHGLVYRYLAHDGLEGEEGTFLLCTFWLAQALALAGELDRAPRRSSAPSPTSTTWASSPKRSTPTTGELLGNFPQAFSHIGLVERGVGDQPGRATSGSGSNIDINIPTAREEP